MDKPTMIEFIAIYWKELILVCLLATLMFQLWVYLQKKYDLYNGWFVCIYTFVNMLLPTYLFFFLVSILE